MSLNQQSIRFNCLHQVCTQWQMMNIWADVKLDNAITFTWLILSDH